MEQDRTIVIGIDLGTSNSCVGVWRNGCVEIIANDQSRRTTPSCVAFTDSERLVGEGANHQVGSNALNTVFDVKRLMGRSFSDASVARDAKYWPFGVMQGPDDKPLIRVSYLGEEKDLSPEEISAMVLVKMKETAEAYVGRPITDAVISVPAYFNGSQRQATKDAGVIAGLNVLRIINEPTAAALAYALNTSWRESTVLVYDLGGGTLDVSVIAINRDGLKVMATAGETHLGGEDFTNNMVEHFVEEFKKKNPDIMGDISDDKKALGRLRRSCEVAKKKLSTNPRIPVEVYALFEGIDFDSEITRQQFEKLNGDLFHRCMEPVAKCLVGSTKVDDVVLVGACTRIPLLHQLVKDFFNGREPCRIVNADEAVACGATAQAAILTLTGSIPTEVLDITPFSLGISTPDGVIWEVVERYTTIPTRKETPPFVRVNDDQYSMDIMVYEDFRAMANKFSIALQHPKNKVLFEIDQDGILQVSVWAQEGWKTFTNLLGRFSKEEMERMVKDTHKYKDQDEKHKKNVQARNDIQNLLFTISNNMKNLEDSAARLLVHMLEATQEQDLQAPAYQDTSRHVYKPHKAQNKDNRKLIQALNDSIKQLQESADGATKWLESKELTTNQIIGKMEQIQGDYHNISSQIENIQARNNIQNLLFTISNNLKSLEDSAARFLIHPEATREQDLHMPHKVQDKGNRKMVQAYNDTINKLHNSIKQLQDTTDGATKWLESKELPTNQIIGKMQKMEGDYNNISSQIENIQARKNIQNFLLTVSNNMKNLEDSASIFLINLEATREHDFHTPQDIRARNSGRPVCMPHKVQDKGNRKMVQAYNDTINKLHNSIKQLKDTTDGATKWLENKELPTNQIIGKMQQLEGDYNSISSQIEHIQARKNIQNFLLTVSNNMKNVKDSAARFLINPESTREQDLHTRGHQDIRARNSTGPVCMSHKVQDKGNMKMVQAYNDTINKLHNSIKQLQDTTDEATKWLESKELPTNQIIGKMQQIEGDYNSICSQIENIQARKNLQNFLLTVSINMKNLEDSAARFLIQQEANSTRPVYMPHKVQDKDDIKMVQAHNDTINKQQYCIKQLQEIADGTTKWLENKDLTTNQILGKMEQIEGEYNSISSQIKNIQAQNDIKNFVFTISNNLKNLEASAARFLIHPEETQEPDLHTRGYQDIRTRNSTGHDYKAHTGHDTESRKVIQTVNDTMKKLQGSIKQLQDRADELTTNQIIGQMEQIDGDYNRISSQIENIQARSDIQNSLFTIRNNLKNLETSTARSLLVHPEATQEEGLQTRQDTTSSWGRFWPHKGHDKKMIQAQNDTIKEPQYKELHNSINELLGKVDVITKRLENEELTTYHIIGQREQIEREYNNISMQIASASH